MTDLFADIGAGTPKGRDGLMPAVLTALTNSAGGVIAGRVRDIIRDQFKQYPSAGDLGVFAISVGIRVYAASSSATDAVLRELAGGMAGEVGDDMWAIIKGWLGLGVRTWETSRAYSKGEAVRYGSQVYQASEDIPASGGAPDADKRWKLLRAQGLDSEQLRQIAAKLAQNEDVWAAIESDFAQALASRYDSIAGEANIQIPKEAYDAFFQHARGALGDIVSRVMAG